MPSATVGVQAGDLEYRRLNAQLHIFHAGPRRHTFFLLLWLLLMALGCFICICSMLPCSCGLSGLQRQSSAPCSMCTSIVVQLLAERTFCKAVESTGS